jgi:ABC-type branched-subunit amino acid transport system ATPase component
MTSGIATSGLSKTYGAVTAVAGLDLRVEPGQIFAFLGPNGAGKSTTIRMLLALQRPTAGKAAMLGLDSQADSVAIHRRVGCLPGDLALFPRLSGRRHIDWFARARGDAGTAFADELVRRFDVELDRPVRQLSTGNRQKIGIVLAFMSRPELLVLDEPTTGLDPRIRPRAGCVADRAPGSSAAARGAGLQGRTDRGTHPPPGHPARARTTARHTVRTTAARAADRPDRPGHRRVLADPRPPAGRHRPRLFRRTRAGGLGDGRGPADGHVWSAPCGT